jgi:hypothetical protein
MLLLMALIYEVRRWDDITSKNRGCSVGTTNDGFIIYADEITSDGMI